MAQLKKVTKDEAAGFRTGPNTGSVYKAILEEFMSTDEDIMRIEWDPREVTDNVSSRGNRLRQVAREMDLQVGVSQRGEDLYLVRRSRQPRERIDDQKLKEASREEEKVAGRREAA